MNFNVLIIGGGAAGMSCALVLGSANDKLFVANKQIGIFMHQKTSALTNGLFNNVLGIKTGTTGKEILENGKIQLAQNYPHIVQIEKEKVLSVKGDSGNFIIITNKSSYKTKMLVVAVGASNLFNIDGLKQYVEPHGIIPAVKQRIQLKNKKQLVVEGIFVAGILAGLPSQFAVAAGSGAMVATDILTKWNNGILAVAHDSIPQ